MFNSHFPCDLTLRPCMHACSGAATTDEGAGALCAAMQKSGLLLRHHNLVYLQAGEISNMVMMMLPGAREEAAANLKVVEGELAEMDKVHKAVSMLVWKSMCGVDKAGGLLEWKLSCTGVGQGPQR